jgi:hypothetical protein
MNEEQQVTQESATEPTSDVISNPPTTESVADPVATPRPEGLPEKFNSWQDMAKSYSELESWKDIKNGLLQELETEAYSNRPASAGDYQIPEILDEAEAATNPLLKWWADYSWNNGLSQEEFDEGIAKWAEHTPQPNLDEVRASLGDNANARVESAQLFMQKFFPAEMQDAVAQLGTSKEGIMALELIQEKMKGINPQQEVVQPSQLTQGDIETAMRDPRYWDTKQRDMNYVREVEAKFKKLYG